MADLEINSIDDLKGHLSDLYERNDVSKIEERITALEQAQNDKQVVDNRDVNQGDDEEGEQNSSEDNQTVGNDHADSTSDDDNTSNDNNSNSGNEQDLDELSKMLGLK